jgi:hypothetical protein
MTTPPIPARLLYRPTIAGRVIPWVNVRLADGGVDFRSQHRRKVEQAWQHGLCQLDGQPLDPGRFVLLAGPNQLRDLTFDEPPLHPECARYTARACEMIAGRMTHYRAGPSVSETHRGKKCFESGCDCAGWVPDGGGASEGDPAHAWYVVWGRGYHVAMRPDGKLHGGALTRGDVRAVSVVTPEGPRVWRQLDAVELDALIVAPAAEQAAP